MSDREMRQLRTIQSKFETREDGGKLSIEGYFAVFNSNYEMAPGLSESIAPGTAFIIVSRLSPSFGIIIRRKIVIIAIKKSSIFQTI